MRAIIKVLEEGYELLGLSGRQRFLRRFAISWLKEGAERMLCANSLVIRHGCRKGLRMEFMNEKDHHLEIHTRILGSVDLPPKSPPS